jgi:iron complex transport system substrate-binding protein
VNSLVPAAAGSSIPDESGANSLSSREIAAGWSAAVAQTAVGWSTSDSAERVVSERLCSFYRTHVPALARAAPAVVLTHVARPRGLTEPDEDEVRAALRWLSPSTRTVLSLDPSTVTEVFAAAHAVARALGTPAAALHAVQATRMRLARVEEYAASVATLQKKAARPASSNVMGFRRRPRVAVVQWADPLYLAGGWVPEAVHLAGGEDPFCRPGGPSVVIEAGDLNRVDVLVVAVCAVGLNGAEKIAEELWHARARELTSCTARVVVVDAVRLFSRASLSAVADSVECMAEILANSGAFSRRHLWREWSNQGRAVLQPALGGLKRARSAGNQFSSDRRLQTSPRVVPT